MLDERINEKWSAVPYAGVWHTNVLISMSPTIATQPAGGGDTAEPGLTQT